jgi:hypothetical protein
MHFLTCDLSDSAAGHLRIEEWGDELSIILNECVHPEKLKSRWGLIKK